MQNHVISEKKRVKFGVLFCEEILDMLVDYFCQDLTRKHEKDLQLIWRNTMLSSESNLL